MRTKVAFLLWNDHFSTRPKVKNSYKSGTFVGCVLTFDFHISCTFFHDSRVALMLVEWATNPVEPETRKTKVRLMGVPLLCFPRVSRKAHSHPGHHSHQFDTSASVSYIHLLQHIRRTKVSDSTFPLECNFCDSQIYLRFVCNGVSKVALVRTKVRIFHFCKKVHACKNTTKVELLYTLSALLRMQKWKIFRITSEDLSDKVDNVRESHTVSMHTWT